jgi:hypothetical protein
MIKSRKVNWAELVSNVGEMRSACRNVFEKPTRRLDDNIKMDHGERERTGARSVPVFGFCEHGMEILVT